MKSKRLSRIDWIQAGFKSLTEAGPDSLKAEALARRIGASKGSFYWHFKDVADFKQEMLAHWRDAAFDNIAGYLAELPTARARLDGLIEIAMAPIAEVYGGSGAETAIRAWAGSDPLAAEALREMDSRRIAYLEQLFGEIGQEDKTAPRIFYASLIGLEELSSRDGVQGASYLRALADLLLSEQGAGA